MSFAPQPLQPKEFTLQMNNFTLRCYLEKFSLTFLIEENKDNIKFIYKSPYYITTLPNEFQQYFDKIQDLFEYINENPQEALNLRDLHSKQMIYVRANIDSRIKQFELPIDIVELSPEQIVKRENLRLKQTLQKTQEQLSKSFKLINEFRVNQSFNNEDFQKLRNKNKKLQTEKRKLESEKNALLDQNQNLKLRLEQIKREIKENMSVVEGQSHIDPEISLVSYNKSQARPLNGINNKKIGDFLNNRKQADSVSVASSSTKKKQVTSQKTITPNPTQVVQLLDEDDGQTDEQKKKNFEHSEDSISVSHASHPPSVSISHDHMSVASKPQSIVSNQSMLLNLEKLSALSEFHSACDSIAYSKKQVKEHKRVAKFQKQFSYFEDNISHICSSESQNYDLFHFFVRKPKTLKLLYRASQNEFQIAKFHRSCDRIKHTILLVQTQFGKKIGAYTPLQYEALKKPRFYEDPNCETFLFSLSNKEKYKLTNCKKALFNSTMYGPSFGRLNLHLEERGHMRRQNKSIFPFDFESSWTTKNEMYSHFAGGGIDKFKAIEWEVYAVEFWE